MIADKLVGQSLTASKDFKLNQQRLADVSGGDPYRVKSLDDPQRFFDHLHRPRPERSDLVESRVEKAGVLIQVADDGLAGGAHILADLGQVQLPDELIVERRLPSQHVLE